MTFFRNLKLGTKLIGGYLSVVAIIMVGTVVGYIGIQTANSNLTRMYNDNLLPVQYLSRVNDALLQIQLLSYKAIAVPEEAKATDQSIRDDLAEVDRQVALYRAGTLSEKEKELLAQFDLYLKEYSDITFATLTTAQTRDASSTIGRMRTGGVQSGALVPLSTTLNGLIAINVQNADESRAQNDLKARTITLLEFGGGLLGIGVAILAGIAITRLICGAVNQSVLMIREISKGHLKLRLNMDSGDEIGDLARAMDQFADNLQNMLNGNLRRIADGDLSVQVAFFDEEDEIAAAEKKIVDTLRDLVAEVNGLTHSAVEGRLATRGDTSQFKGAFKQVVEGVNDTLNVVIGPLNGAAESLQQFAQGTLTTRITAEYPGNFAKIKDSVNAVVDMLAMRNADIQSLIQACVEGKLSTRADVSKYTGANGSVLEGVNRILDGVTLPMQQASQAMAQVADWDLTVKLNGNFRGDYAMLKNGVETMVAGLRGVGGQWHQSALDMTSATSQILSSSTQNVRATGQQASAVNQITSTVQEIKASAEQVAQRAQGVAESASRAIQVSLKGKEAASAAIDGMQAIERRGQAIAENILALSEKTQQIGDIIDSVSDLAGQSNILALNAAIEAAQAGEAGKGFRVVADEVRSLSEQSRQAAAQVKIILGDIQKATNLAVITTEEGSKGVSAGSELVTRAAESITELALAVETSSQAAGQIVAGVEQQTIGLDQIALGMNDINEAAQQSAAGARQIQKAAQDLQTLSEQLSQTVAQYRM